MQESVNGKYKILIRITPEEPATPYPLPAPHLRVRGTSVTEMDLMVYGIMHRSTGKATYNNINLYIQEKQLSIASIFDDDIEGTAANYLPAEHPATNLMYALKIARNCNGKSGCLEVRSGSH